MSNQLAEQLAQFINEYYRKFDAREPLEAFEDDVDWDDLLISSPDSKVSTKEEYAMFYQGITEAFVDSTHQMSNLVVTHHSDELVNAACDVVFAAKQKPDLAPVEVTGRIQISFKPAANHETRKSNTAWKISRYLIGVN